MKTLTRTRGFSGLTVVAAAVSIVGCWSTQERMSTPAPCTFPPQTPADGGPGQELFVCPVGPSTVSSVRVFIGIHNNGDQPVRARPRFELGGTLIPLLTDGDGEQVAYEASWEAVEVSPEDMEYVLPPDGVVGRIVDLVCAMPDFGFESPSCLPVFSWHPGRYRLQMDYIRLWTCARAPCVGTNVVDRDLISEPVDLIVDP